MIKIATLAAAFAVAMGTISYAQTTGPSGQQDTNKPGMANPNSGSGMSSGSSMTKSNSMSNPNATSATTPGSTTGPSGQTPKAATK